MARRKSTIRQAEIVQRFAARLREVRRSRGVTQVDLARRAEVTVSYIWRLETAGAAPGIDLLDRLAAALGTTPGDLLPAAARPDTLGAMKDQARRLFEALVTAADLDTMLMLNPLLARLGGSEPPAR